MKKVQDIKNWDFITITLLIISIVTIGFSFYAPLLFTGEQTNSRYDFKQTGAIGDTIGGLMNPFVALAGVFLTFLAFYMQIKANQIQITQFTKGLKADKDNILRNEKLDCYYKLSLLRQDLLSISKDIKNKAFRINEYIEKEKSRIFQTNILRRTASKEYSRILEMDRLLIYKGFKYFLPQNDWVKTFSQLYSILDFLPEYFKNIYDIYDYHTMDIFNEKNEIKNNLNELMNNCSTIINNYKVKYNADTYSNFPASNLCNETILRYHKIIEETFDENKIPIRETNIEKINSEVLQFFLEKSMTQRDDNSTFDRSLEPIMGLVSDIRRKIEAIKNRMTEVASNIETEYNNLMVDKESEKSYLSILEEIETIINTELQKIDVQKI